jgi:hypothetical protein
MLVRTFLAVAAVLLIVGPGRAEDLDCPIDHGAADPLWKLVNRFPKLGNLPSLMASPIAPLHFQAPPFFDPLPSAQKYMKTAIDTLIATTSAIARAMSAANED